MAKQKYKAWMKVFPGDYYRNTTHLTTIEHGAYWLLWLYAWEHDGFLPGSDEEISVVTKLSVPEWRKLKNKLLKLFDVDDAGRYCMTDLILELESAKQNYEKKCAAGRLGADTRWHSNGSTPDDTS